MIPSRTSRPIRDGENGFSDRVKITRPSNTSLYGAGDAIGVADSATPANAGSAIIEFVGMGPPGAHILITAASLRIDLAAIPSGMTSFILHLYNVAPDAILDNAVWDLSSAADRSKYLGSINLGAPSDIGSSLFAEFPYPVSKQVKLAKGSSSLFGVLQTVGTYTPASGTVYTPELQAMGL